jgi:5'-3' exonuclease
MQYFIIDTLNLAYRAHCVNFELKNSSGEFSGMFFGFVRTLVSLKKKYRGYKFVCVWDSKPVAKYALQPDYKSGRSSLPSTVTSQFNDIREFLENCGVDQYGKKDEEADDVIATLVENFKREGAKNIIVYSNDKDMLQLVETGKVIVYKPKVATSPEKFYDDGAVMEQFGVPPSKLALFRSFDGDASDVITGVERVPRKIIAKIVNESDSVQACYDLIDKEKLTEFQKKSFQEARERIYVNSKIVTLKRDLEDIIKTEAVVNKEKMAEFFSKFDIKSIQPEVVSDLFSSTLNIRYSEARPTIEIESYTLF